MRGNKKYLVFGICVAFVLFSAFAGVASAATGHVKEWGSVGSNPAPEEEWDRAFGGSGLDRGYSVQQTSDGGYIIVGETYSSGTGESAVWLIKTNSKGIKEWDRTFGGLIWNGVGYTVQQTSDSGYIIVGETSSCLSDIATSDVWLIKTDSEGIKEWDRKFGRLFDDCGYSVQQTSDGGYIIVGETWGITTSDVWLIKMDSKGSEEWDRTFSKSGVNKGYSVQQTSDGGYIITGMEGPFFGIYDVLLIKTDSEGNEEWNRTFGGWCDTCGRSVQQTSDGGYIIAGWVYPYLFGIGSKDVLLIKTDSKGNEEWNRTFGGSDHDCGYSVQQTSDGGYIITGYTNSSGAGESDVLLIKTDSHGNKEWAMTIGGSSLDKGYSVEQTSDGGHIIVGETYSSGTGDGDVWLIKITPPSEKEAPGFEAIFAIAGLVVLAYFLKMRKLNNG